MTPGPGSEGKARLFAALDLPDRVRAALHSWRPSDPGLRGVGQESLHLTLAFLGWREQADAERIGALVTGCAGPVRELEVGEPRWLPARRPRVLAVELRDGRGELEALQARVSAALAGGAGYVPEKRQFLAHITVARVRRGAHPMPGELPVPPQLSFDGAALTLYRSHLGAAGARYEPVASAALG